MTTRPDTDTLRIKVDGGVCMGHAMCNALAPEVYEVDDAGFNRMGEFELDPAGRGAAERGASACPERAISFPRSGPTAG
ncbi:ferredoxin [Umezawaea tangerina]|uniref:Ferredoxin n=1 Tax=Umezawaea tangerina TaxID=84725 RepID=A0A2T0SN86_9PSEU|nr:ferredoxin [Umezawaea tangerina]PRY34882.1 ferredoxin [Umezawaea tangerina]